MVVKKRKNRKKLFEDCYPDEKSSLNSCQIIFSYVATACPLEIWRFSFSDVILAGYGAVPSDWQELRYKGVHELQIWDDVLGSSSSHLLHKAGRCSNIFLECEFEIIQDLSSVGLFSGWSYFPIIYDPRGRLMVASLLSQATKKAQKSLSPPLNE